MKKLIFINVLTLVAGIAFGQSGKNNGSSPKEATINGVSYSQYKAQQDALKQNATVATPAPAQTQMITQKDVKVSEAKPVAETNPAVKTATLSVEKNSTV